MGLGEGLGRGVRDEVRGARSSMILRQLGKQWGVSRTQCDLICLLRGTLWPICGERVG